MGTRRGGFTLVEFVVALSLASLLLIGIWGIIELLDKQHRMTREATDMTAVALDIYADFQREIWRAGSGLFAAPNISGVRIAPADLDGHPRDTLTLLYGLSGTATVSSGECVQFTGDCISLQGDATWANVGTLLLVGNSLTGGRILQVTARSEPYLRNCAGDCTIVVACTDEPGDPLIAPVVMGSTMYYPDATSTTSPEPCPQSYYPDGRWCEEDVEFIQVGTAVSNNCGLSALPPDTYTDIAYADRTDIFGFPPLSTTVLRSGSMGVPAVRALELGFVRYWVGETPGGASALLKQHVLNADGTWGPALPLPGQVESLELWVRHPDAAEFRRGLLADSASLVLDGGNPNWIELAVPEPNSISFAHRFLQSYRDVAAVRVAYTLRAMHATTGDRIAERATFRATFGTLALLHGGVQR